MPTILVTGDFIHDVNLLRFPIGPEAHSTWLPKAVLKEENGGSHYVATLLRSACDGGPDTTVLWHRATASRAYSVWWAHPEEQGSKEKKGEVWRVGEFLGCEPYEPSATDPRSDPDAESRSDPDLLVIDDLGRTFRSDPSHWPAALRDGGNPRRILWKVTVPFAGTTLWERLRTDFADRLTVVMPASLLRSLDASLSTALSWDRTIADVKRAFSERFSRESIGLCRRVVVTFGLEGAASFTREALKLGPGYPESACVQFERLVYHPELLEGDWATRRPGKVYGATSIVTAALAKHDVQENAYPLNIALSRALSAMRSNHEAGGGPVKKGELASPDAAVWLRLQDAAGAREALAVHTAFPSCALDKGSLLARWPADQSFLLRDFTGGAREQVAAVALDIIRKGVDAALPSVPRLRCKKLVTADPTEIERFNAIRARISAYRLSKSRPRPLSFAVFGPPGSGKSFGIKQLAEDLFGEQAAVLTFNVSQFEGIRDLRTALHQVRDCSLRGSLPLVFWDEFDSDREGKPLGWLKDFLAPMQDGHFAAESTTHPIGGAIFVFAGGTKPSFAEFNQTEDAELKRTKKDAKAFRNAKGPDFVRRLATFLDIKGPNPTEVENGEGAYPAYLIRRAFLVRSILEREARHLLGDNQFARISMGVAAAFLRVEKYQHGAGSLETVLQSSSLADTRYFNTACLPPPEMLRVHVTPDFLDHAQEERMEDEVIERLAIAAHSAWCKQREAAASGDLSKKHPWAVPFEDLEPRVKERNRRAVRMTKAHLHEVGLSIVPRDLTAGLTALSGAERARLLELSHDAWHRAHLLEGYEHASSTNHALLLHEHLAPWSTLSEEGKQLNEPNVDSIAEALWESGYMLERGTKDRARDAPLGFAGRRVTALRHFRPDFTENSG